jgi:prepilin-type N-terminal cleavage/methylation domain-containing protein
MVAISKRGFSLIETVLAVGIVSIALLSMFGLFSNALKSNSETLSQHEAIGLTRAFGDFLQSTNSGAGFTNVFNWVKNTDSAPEIYAFAARDGSFTNGLASDSGFLNAAGQRPGRLFRMVIALSPNMPIHAANGTPIPNPTTGDLPGNAALYLDGTIALQVRTYAVSAPGMSIAQAQPLFTYETGVRR